MAKLLVFWRLGVVRKRPCQRACPGYIHSWHPIMSRKKYLSLQKHKV
jgi:hypothetical protein